LSSYFFYKMSSYISVSRINFIFILIFYCWHNIVFFKCCYMFNWVSTLMCTFHIFRGKVIFKGRKFKILLKSMRTKLSTIHTFHIFRALHFCFYLFYLIFYCRHSFLFWTKFRCISLDAFRMILNIKTMISSNSWFS
jgi:hypothetical protein